MMQQPWVKVPGEKPYFWNLETQETRWSEPAGEDVAWVVQRTAEGGMYYWNKKTDETTWDQPFVVRSHRKTVGRRSPASASDEENDPRFANAAAGLGSMRLGWKAHQTPEGFAYSAMPEVNEPLSTWPLMEGQSILAHQGMPLGKIEPSPMMVVHALKPSNPAGSMVSFTDGRMMTKLPTCMGGATLVPMQGSAAKLKALAKGKSGPTMEAADHLSSRYLVKGGPSGGSAAGGMLAQSGLWDINRLQELNCQFVDASGFKKKSPLNLTSLQIEAVKTLDGTSASFIPGCLNDAMPFCCAAEEYAYFEQSSINAASKRMQYMRSRGLVAASIRVAAKLLSCSWTPGIVSSDWKPYMRPKTLQPWLEKHGGKMPMLGGPGAGETPWWQQPEAAGAAPRARGPAPEMGKAKSDALSAAKLLLSLRNTVLDILGTDAIEDDTSLFHAGVNTIKPISINDNLQAIAPEDLGAYPDHHHDLTTGFEPPAPSQEAALAKAGEKAAAGESEKGCRATATRIRSSASSFYTLMGSTAADYSTMALNIPQGGAGRGPGLSASPFTAALGP